MKQEEPRTRERMLKSIYDAHNDGRECMCPYCTAMRGDLPYGPYVGGEESKYGTVTTTKKGITKDEPVFLLRAQDKLAAQAVLFYAGLRAAAGDDKGAEACGAVAKKFIDWPVKKMPD